MTTSENILHILDTVLPLLHQIEEEQASEKLNPKKWSKKEIIGHLIDSANNNHQKFVRAINQSVIHFVGYEQNNWVRSSYYQNANWHLLLQLWDSYNRFLAHFISQIATTYQANEIYVDDFGPFRLNFITADYAEHLKHHLKQILPDLDLTINFSSAVYGL